MSETTPLPERLSPDQLAFLRHVMGRIRDARKARGRTQGDVAGALEISRTQYNNIECGRSVPSVVQVADIAAYLQVPLVWCFAGQPVHVRPLAGVIPADTTGEAAHG